MVGFFMIILLIGGMLFSNGVREYYSYEMMFRLKSYVLELYFIDYFYDGIFIGEVEVFNGVLSGSYNLSKGLKRKRLEYFGVQLVFVYDGGEVKIVLGLG